MEKEINLIKDKSIGSLIGLAIGDALGTTLEFKHRDTTKKITDIVGGGVFELEAGEWTDDTSMALCLAMSIIKTGFDPKDQMNNYLKWYREGYLSSNGRCFDIGFTVRHALIEYDERKKFYAGKTDEQSAGNGSLMRIAPVPIAFRCDCEDIKSEKFNNLINNAKNSSRTTHGENRCIEACVAYSLMINKAINNKTKEEILNFSQEEKDLFKEEDILNIINGSYKNKIRDQIKSSGFVIDTLEAALWSFYNTNNFEDSIILSANLAHDSDTVAAICGQLSGAFYGLQGIPEKWIKKIKYSERIIAIANELYKISIRGKI